MMVILIFFITAITVLVSSVWLTFAIILPRIRVRMSPGSVRMCSVLGSGGHTTEMLKLVTSLDKKTYHPRIYLIADTDNFSEAKLTEAEEDTNKDWSVVRIPRSREVGQSYLSSVITTLVSFYHCLLPILEHQPQLLLVNGPGTCLPVAVTCWVMSVARLSPCKIIFVESLCRVKTLSLTGKILQYLADESLVQWPELVQKYPRTKYIGKFL